VKEPRELKNSITYTEKILSLLLLSDNTNTINVLIIVILVKPPPQRCVSLVKKTELMLLIVFVPMDIMKIHTLISAYLVERNVKLVTKTIVSLVNVTESNQNKDVFHLLVIGITVKNALHHVTTNVKNVIWTVTVLNVEPTPVQFLPVIVTLIITLKYIKEEKFVKFVT
jgi:hypothetical protein